MGALTLGYGNSRVRGGASIILEDGNKPMYQLLGRFDLRADHKYWTEIYIPINLKKDDKMVNSVMIRFAANF